jgi:hypothetical protein
MFADAFGRFRVENNILRTELIEVKALVKASFAVIR